MDYPDHTPYGICTCDACEKNQLRQRVQELEELLKESYKDADEVLRPRVQELEFALAETEALEMSHGERIEKPTADQVLAATKPLEEEIERLNNPCQTPVPDDIAAQIERTDWTPEQALQFYADQRNFDIVEGRARIIDNGAVASNTLKHLTLERLELKGDAELSELRQQLSLKQKQLADMADEWTAERDMWKQQLAEKDAEIAFQKNAHNQAQQLLLEQGKQLAEKDVKIERLKTVPMKYRRMEFNAQLQEENAELRQQLAEVQQLADHRESMRATLRNDIREMRKQLAAAQAREQQLRNLIEHAPISSGVCCCGDSMDRHPDPMVCGHSPVDQWDWAVLSLLKETQDTTALEAIVEKAGEVMREVAAKIVVTYGCAGRTIKDTEQAIRALPGVKLEDLSHV